MKYLAIIAVIILAVGGYAYFFNPEPSVLLGGPEVNRFQSDVSHTLVSVTSASTTVLSANTARAYAMITNIDSSNVVYVNLGNDAAWKTGIELAAGESYEIDADNLYVGLITAIATTTVEVVTVEK
jgi:hypothetical protein|tara:strand:- start:820 stop:1197 length:378 start_codon:yes stop_codon:yes gene_type:complete